MDNGSDMDQAQLHHFARSVLAAMAADGAMITVLHRKDGKTRAMRGLAGGDGFKDDADMVTSFVMDALHFAEHVIQDSGAKIELVMPDGRREPIENIGKGLSIHRTTG